MAVTYPLPEVDKIGMHISSIVGKKVDTGSTDPVDGKAAKNGVIGVYESEDGVVGGVCVCSTAFAAFAGAALAMIPPAVAQTAATSGQIPANIQENVGEVLNILSSLFNKEGSPRLSLKKVINAGDDIPEGVSILITEPAGREDITIDIPGYGAGTMTLLVAEQ